MRKWNMQLLRLKIRDNISMCVMVVFEEIIV